MDISERVLYEDNHLILVNKLPGEIVQGDKTGDETLGDKIKKYLKKKYDKPGEVFLGTVHRLDRPVSGVILFARTSKALSRMNKAFQDRNVQKTYWALTITPPVPEQHRPVHYLKKDRQKNIVKAFTKEVKDSQRAELEYQLVKRHKNNFLVEVNPITGRPHQIRVQLGESLAIIKGDLKYGAPQPNKDKSICLHARRLAFTHPVSKEKMSIQASILNRSEWGGLS